MSEAPHFRFNGGTFEKQMSPIDRSNPTSAYLGEIIERQGRIPFSQYMHGCLYGPGGYYSAGKAQIGLDLEERDFITSPEINPLFGASLGLLSKQVWEAMGRPEAFPIIEQGAGNGTLADSLLDWAGKEARGSHLSRQFYDSLSYPIIECGDFIYKQQRQIKDSQKVNWTRDSAIDFPPNNVNGVILSNELPDTFPIEVVRRFKISDHLTGVMQQYVSIENNHWLEIWDEPATDVTNYINKYGIEVQEDETPVNLEALRWQQNMDSSLQSGAIITIDYGAHQYGRIRVYGGDKNPYNRTAIYQSPGGVDITSDVNFAALRSQAESDGLRTAFFGPESEFLRKAGIDQLTHGIAEKIRDSRSLSETLELSEHLAGLRFLLDDDSERWNALVLTKGLSDFELAGDTIHPNDKPRYKLEVGYARRVVDIGGIIKMSDDYEQLWLDPVEMPPHELFLRKITSGGVEQSPEDILQIFENSGYRFDISPH